MKPIGGPCQYCGEQVSAGYPHKLNCPRSQSLPESKNDIDKILNMYISIDMPDGTQWAVPVISVARHRAEYFANRTDEFGSFIDSLHSDTIPCFLENEDEIMDWAENNMDWSDVQHVAMSLQTEREQRSDLYQDGWCNGDKEIIDKDELLRERAEVFVTDTELLDFLQKKLDEKRYGGKIICRWSSNGRGIRLHETEIEGAVSDVREAITNFIKGDTPLETPNEKS